MIDVKTLNQTIASNINDIVDHFGLDFRSQNRYLSGSCPVHGGDNQTAFNFYLDSSIGNWQCYTHQCEKIFQPNAVGFIRGVLSHHKYGWKSKKDKNVDFYEAVNWCSEFFNCEVDTTKKPKVRSDYNLTRIINNRLELNKSFELTRDQFRRYLEFPCEYYVERGYSEEVLDEFDVGTCMTRGKKMYGRAIVPIYDDRGEYIIGCTGRSIWSQCGLCKGYHSDERMCPSKQYVGLYSKWKHSKNFPSKFLYNYYKCKSNLFDLDYIILVEGCGSVWRLYEAGFKNVMSTFGSKFCTQQKKWVDKLGVSTIILLRDADSAGQTMLKQLKNVAQEQYNIICPYPTYEDDVCDLDDDKIKELIHGAIQ